MSGVTLILTCSISLPIAIPNTSGVQWEGPEVIPDPDNSKSGRIISSVLTLSQTETIQSGLYKCNFSFSGSVSASMTIEILGKYPRHKLIHNPIPTSVMCLIVLSDSPNLLSQHMSEGERFGSVGKRVHS